ncbi:MAG: radical SAM family heme chaperone HemW [Desulfuromonadales bacterium]
MASLYIHVPFCRRKCPYCDFYSVAGYEQDLADYPDLLNRQLKQLYTRHGTHALESVFFGGGTPSLLPPRAVGKVLEAVDSVFPFARAAEISLEANPGTVSAQSLCGYRSAGVNRISLGIQSLQDAQLRQLGRLHNAADAVSSLRWARQAGFESISADLMFALPGQGIQELIADARRLAAEVDHLSCYGLSIEEETPFYHLHRSGGLELPSEDLYAEHFLALDSTLADLGMRHYEISNYALPGSECRHNLAYWRRSTCLGLGAGAHAFYDRGWGERRFVPPDLKRYRRRLTTGRPVEERLETFDRRGAMCETLYLGLRTAEGVSEEAFRTRFGCGLAEAFPEAAARNAGRLKLDSGRWRFSPPDWLLFDTLILPFLG